MVYGVRQSRVARELDTAASDAVDLIAELEEKVTDLETALEDKSGELESAEEDIRALENDLDRLKDEE